MSPQISEAHSVWQHSVAHGCSAVASTLRRLTLFVRGDAIAVQITVPRCPAPLRAMRPVSPLDLDSNVSHVVSYASGFDDFERILDAHRRPQPMTEIPRRTSPSHANTCGCNDDVLPGKAGVWFSQGRQRGVVDLSHSPKHGWFELYVQKT